MTQRLNRPVRGSTLDERANFYDDLKLNKAFDSCYM